MQNFDIFDYYLKHKSDEILFSFRGAVSQKILELLGDIVSTRTSGSKAVSRMFAVFVELAQNIMYYSAETEQGLGSGIIVFSESKGEFTLSCGNIISNTKLDKLTEKIDTSLKAKPDQLRKILSQERRKPPLEDSRGAGIGIYEIVKKSDGNIEYKTYKTDSLHSFIAITVHTKKESENE